MPPAQASGLPKLKRSSSDFALSHSAKASRLLSPDDVDAVLATECCKHKCIGQLPRPLLEDLRKRYVQLRTERARTEWLSMELAMLRHSPVQRRLHYSLFGRPVCRHAFQLALDLSNDKMEAAYNKALDNVRNDAVLRSSATPRDTPASTHSFVCNAKPCATLFRRQKGLPTFGRSGGPGKLASTLNMSAGHAHALRFWLPKWLPSRRSQPFAKNTSATW